MKFFQLVILYYFLINLIGFVAYGLDKHKAVKGRWRIPEKTLILIAFFGGAIGAMVGMKLFHHKTNKIKFNIMIPFALLLHIALLCYKFIFS